jgi:hypothetical protein
MGNVLSEEPDAPEFLEEGFNLDSPDADKEINFGTAAPVWQNKKEIDEEDRNVDDERTEGGKEVLLMKEQTMSSNSSNEPKQKGSSNEGTSAKNNRQDSTLSESSDPQTSQQQQRQNSTSSANSADSQNPKKMSYIQMAKMGYQELVNAIIRPPRCDYKVSVSGT